jgi:hypothetical protein
MWAHPYRFLNQLKSFVNAVKDFPSLFFKSRIFFILASSEKQLKIKIIQLL